MTQPNVKRRLPTAVVDEPVGGSSLRPRPGGGRHRHRTAPAAMTPQFAATALRRGTSARLRPDAGGNPLPRKRGTNYSIQPDGASNTQAVVDSFRPSMGHGKVWVYKTRFPWQPLVRWCRATMPTAIPG